MTTGPIPPSSEPGPAIEPGGRPFSDRLIPDELAQEVLERASRYAAAAQEGYEPSDLLAAGAEVDLPPQLIERAIREIEAERREAAARAERRQRLRQRLLLGVTAALGLAGLGLEIVANGLLRQARAALSQASTPAKKARASDRVDAVIDRFHRRLAAEPAAGRDPLLLALQDEITGAENRLTMERRRYKQAMEAYKRSLASFSGVLPARWLHLSSRPCFRGASSGKESSGSTRPRAASATP